jgi:hypothetical protein
VIRILADGPNEQGDVLTRLARDVFFILGYDDCRLNVHKTGRELDLLATHRHEQRDVVAEFKSGASPAGGADVNKFAGALDAQRRRAGRRPVHGYFVSLAGFTATALEQERELGDPRVVLLDGARLAAELIEGRIVVPPVRAIIAAQQAAPPPLTAEEEGELIGHRSGWVWAVYFVGEGGRRRAVCLIHADGTPLSTTAAAAIAATGPASRNPLTGLRILNRDAPETAAPAIRGTYLSYLLGEFGGITLEGMPADQSVGPGRFKLESLYVPVRLVEAGEEAVPRPPGEGVGETMARHPHLAVLGLPGSGKTTLLKRLAVAYADPSRLADSDDGLAKRDSFPVVVKCRQLGGQARRPILSVIGDQADLAEMPGRRDEFVALVTRELRGGRLLLLVDGLDEIADTGDRAYFVAQLRTFIGVYPTCRLVMTSREAGFRSVAASIATVCHPVRVAGLSGDAIRSLVRSWHTEVVGNTAQVRDRADRLADAIIKTDRVRSLAANPMLLTTLLLVQRWMGELPRRRSVLYDKAIEVLLATWNIEGHEPLDKGEAIPQLAYTAFAMMAGGKTSVTEDELAGLLAASRRDLPETLAYAHMSVYEFIRRVEERSSLMTLSGHEVVDGRLRPTYEFKHLTFQEYLAAVAVTEGWIEARLRDQPIEETLAPFLSSAAWQEVVTLSAVLGGRRAAGIVTSLMEQLQAGDNQRSRRPRNRLLADETRLANLIGCLRDEAALTPDLARAAIDLCVDVWRRFRTGESVGQAVHGGRYDEMTRTVVRARLDPADPRALAFALVLGDMTVLDYGRDGGDLDLDGWLASRLSCDDEETRRSGLAALLSTVTDLGPRSSQITVLCPRSAALVVDDLLFRPVREDVRTLLSLRLLPEILAGSALDDGSVNELQKRIVRAWMAGGGTLFIRIALWALTATPLVGAWHPTEAERAEHLAFADRQAGPHARNRDERRDGSRLIRRYLWPREKWPALISEVVGTARPDIDDRDSFTTRLLQSLGEEGRAAAASALDGRLGKS